MKTSAVTFGQESLNGQADPQPNPLIHPISHILSPLFFFTGETLELFSRSSSYNYLPHTSTFLIQGPPHYIQSVVSWLWRMWMGQLWMWLSGVLLCFHPVWPPPWPVSEQPVSPVPAWWRCSWSWLLWGCQPKTSACWSLLTGCCKFKQDRNEVETLLKLQRWFALIEGYARSNFRGL